MSKYKEIHKILEKINTDIRRVKKIVSDEANKNILDDLIIDNSIIKTVKKGGQSNDVGYIYLPKDFIGCKVKVTVKEVKK